MRACDCNVTPGSLHGETVQRRQRTNQIVFQDDAFVEPINFACQEKTMLIPFLTVANQHHGMQTSALASRFARMH